MSWSKIPAPRMRYCISPQPLTPASLNMNKELIWYIVFGLLFHSRKVQVETPPVVVTYNFQDRELPVVDLKEFASALISARSQMAVFLAPHSLSSAHYGDLHVIQADL